MDDFFVTITRMKHAPDGATSGVAIGGVGVRGRCLLLFLFYVVTHPLSPDPIP